MIERPDAGVERNGQYPTVKEGCWTVAAASEAGVSHVRASLPCQDAHGYRVLANGWLAVAVADGAGSAELADVGATSSVQIALDSIEDRIRRNDIALIDPMDGFNVGDMPPWLHHMLHQTLQEVRAGLDAIATERDTPVRELATTLLLAIVTPGSVAAVQVGDGAIVGWDRDGGLFSVTRPPDSEYANSTTFICSPDAIETAQWGYMASDSGVGGLAAFSDGLQRLALKMPEGEPHSPFFSPLYQFMKNLAMQNTLPSDAATRQISGFLRSPRIQERADDDLTLLLALYTDTVPFTGTGGEQG